jgi:hypothetical protein
MTVVDAGHVGGCLNFVAEIHRMPEYPWQCLDFRGTGHVFCILTAQSNVLVPESI